MLEIPYSTQDSSLQQQSIQPKAWHSNAHCSPGTWKAGGSGVEDQATQQVQGRPWLHETLSQKQQQSI